MARMGADGYSSSGTTRVSIKTSEPLKEDFKQACDDEDVTMTEVIEDAMAEFVADHGGQQTEDGYYPDDSDLRDLYEACLRHADDLRVYQRRHASKIAQDTQQVAKGDLADALMPLRKRGYVALGPVPLDLDRKVADRWRNWYVKPPCADPELWKYRENQQSQPTIGRVAHGD